jgi:hypothetical protein
MVSAWQGRVVVASVVIVQSRRPIINLPGVLAVGDNRPVGIPSFAPCAITQFAPERAIGLEHNARRTKMVI